MAGCSLAPLAPSVNVLGSFFPAWLISIVVGIVLTVLVRQVIVVALWSTSSPKTSTAR